MTVVEVGGGVRGFTHAGRPVLDGCEPDEMATFAQGQALIPWPNRLADGRYEFVGRGQQLPLTEPAKQLRLAPRCGDRLVHLLHRQLPSVLEHARALRSSAGNGAIGTTVASGSASGHEQAIG